MNKNQLTASILVTLSLTGCDQTIQSDDRSKSNIASQELKQFIQSVRGNLVFVEGGEFLMGDYGPQLDETRLPYDADQDSKPLHRIELHSYSIEKFKITNQNYQIYLDHNALQLRQDVAGAGTYEAISVPAKNPAHMDWFEAEKYCSWLADLSELPFALPTEAQWEYAARSRGQYLMVATNDGTYRVTQALTTERDGPRGINISSTWDRRAFAKKMGWKTGGLTPLPVDMFPPNPLGLYSMSDNGLEWVKDWYDPEYYKYSPVENPQGPEKPSHKDNFGNPTKVLRGQGFANPRWGGGVNVYRTAAEPHGHEMNNGVPYLTDKTARCVVNSPLPVKQPDE